MQVFISHSHQDAPLAVALAELLEVGLSRKPEFSSDAAPDRGLQGGADWRQWIRRQIQECEVAIVILTPASVASDWVQWEAGAIEGVRLALARHAAESAPYVARKLLPLTFGLSADALPDTLSDLQGIDGLARESLMSAITGLITDAANDADDPFTSYGDIAARTIRIGSAVDVFLDTARAHALDLPAEQTEGNFQEWLDRIDKWQADGKSAQLGSLHRWLELAFSNSVERRTRPLDMRIHRRLGEVYSKARQPERAVEQFDLALQAAPRDVFLLRQLGTALLDLGNVDRCGEVISRITAIDARAFDENTECAGLKGRWHRERFERTNNPTELLAAAKAYEAGLAADPGSTYMATNVGQTYLLSGDDDAARRGFEGVLSAREESGDNSQWGLTAGVEAYLFLGRTDEAIALAGRLGEQHPSRREIGTFLEGYDRILSKTVGDGDERRELLGRLERAIKSAN